MNIINEANQLFKFGFNPIPLNGKKSILPWKKYQSEKITDEDFFKIWEGKETCNVGIVTGLGFVVVDADTAEAVAWVYQNLTQTPYKVKTSRGYHFYFKTSQVLKSFSNDLLKIDFKSIGGYVVAPPSVHPISKKHYVWENDHGFTSIDNFPEITNEDIEKIQTFGGSIQDVFHAVATKLNKSKQGLTSDNEKTFTACCPFHDDNNNSFSLTLKNNGTLLMNCFKGCIKQLGFGEACRRLGFNGSKFNPNKNESDELVKLTDYRDFETRDRKPIPKHLLKPSGLLEEVLNYTLNISHRKQPVFALAGALSFCSVLFARKVQTEGGSSTGLYCILSGETASGKSAPQDAIKNILQAELPTGKTGEDLLGVDRVLSDSGLVNQLKLHPSKIMFFDEFGQFLEQISNPRASSHQEKIKSCLLSYFNQSDYLGSAKAGMTKDDVKSERVEKPSLSIIGASTPQNLYEALGAKSVVDGFLNRLLIFVTDDSLPKRNKVNIRDHKVPASILESVSWWNSQTCNDEPEGDLDFSYSPRVVPYTEEAEDLLDQYYEEIDDIMRILIEEERPNIYQRGGVLIERIALIHACSLGHNEIGLASVSYSYDLVMYLLIELDREVNTFFADNGTEKQCKKIYNLIEHYYKKKKGEPATRRELLNSSKYTQKDLDLIVELLIARGQVVEIQKRVNSIAFAPILTKSGKSV